MDQPSRLGPLDAPILLHLVHPLTLANLTAVVSHVNRFQKYLASMTPKQENSWYARSIILDLVDSSGVALKALEDILSTAIPEANAIPSACINYILYSLKPYTPCPAEEAMASFVEGHPMPAQHELLKKIIRSLTTSSAIDKPRLFIKSSDLVDGFANLSTSDRSAGDDPGMDVVTKSMLLKQNPSLLCLRCGRRSQVGGEVMVAGHLSPRWKTWERMWATRCICEESWIT